MRLLALAVTAIVSSLPSLAAAFRAATTKADITPPGAEQLWGYEDRVKPAIGTLDPLYARVLVLESGDKRLGIVTLDLGRTFGPAALREIRDSARRTSRISWLLVTASHTHSAPVIADFYKKGTPAWEKAAIGKIEHAIDSAASGLTEARIGSGTGAVYIGHNRLHVNADGSVSWFERNLTQVPTSPVDPTVTVLRIDRTDGSPMAILTNYACHPVVFGSDNLRYSADFPGVMNRVVEEKLGKGVLSFFLQGAPGDINPYYAVTPLQEDPVKWRDWTGERLGREAARVAGEIHTQAPAAPLIEFAEETIPAKLRWDPEKFRAALIKFMGPDAMNSDGVEIKAEFPIEAATVLINKQIALMTVPGEPFVDFQTNWRDRCPVPVALLLGYTNGYNGYFPTIAAASRGGYGAASAATWVETGAGEHLVDRSVAKVYEMLGRLTNMPDDLKGDVYSK